MTIEIIQIDGDQEYQEGLVAAARIRQLVRERNQLQARGETDGILTNSQIADLVMQERQSQSAPPPLPAS